MFEAVAEQRQHRRHHALERDRAGQILQPADGRLGAQVGSRFGQPAHRHLEGWIGSQGVAIIGVGIARGNRQRPEADHLRQPVNDPVGGARVLQAAGQTIGHAQPPLDLGQQQNPAIPPVYSFLRHLVSGRETAGR